MAKRPRQKTAGYDTRTRPGAPLTPRQLKILKWQAKGYGQPEIAARTGINRHTVDWEVRHINKKLRAKGTTQAVYNAFRKGLIR
jgi:DNA-binding CsgD family transcriptional regulator